MNKPFKYTTVNQPVNPTQMFTTVTKDLTPVKFTITMLLLDHHAVNETQ